MSIRSITLKYRLALQYRVHQAGHLSNYYLGETIQDDEVAAVQSAAEKLGIAIENTRCALISASPVVI